MIELLVTLFILWLLMTCFLAPFVLGLKLICLPFQAVAAILKAIVKKN